jgi:hypothetical protein
VAGESRPLIEVIETLAQAEGVKSGLDWRALAQPENYLGETDKIIDETLGRAAKLAR